MKKMLIFAAPVLALSFFTPWFIYTQGAKPPLSYICESNQSLTTYWQYDKNIPITINADLFISFIDSENGIFTVVGTVEKNGNVYFLSRRINFHTSPKMLNGMKRVTFTKESVQPVDNTPDEIWQKYFLPEKLGVDFYAGAKMINDNTLYFKGFSNPYTICVIPE